jgi:zinc transport system ATP-binding protein
MFMSDVVEVAHGVVAYDGRPVLRDVSLRVRSGEVVAILGANGSGKSTLVRALLGLVPLAGGRVSLFGTPLAKFRQWRRIGYVPQRVGAGSGVPATVGEVVASGRLAGRGVLRPAGAADRAAVTAALEAVGLADRVHDPVSTLSGGQQQRTLIARALAGRPELLVLDEPTAGVDAASQDAFADALRGFVLGPLEPLVTRAVVVHDGRIAHDGAVPEPAGHHAEPGHDHVHPHASPNLHAGMWER